MNRQEKLADIREHPELHQHNFNELLQCSFIDGAVDIGIQDAHAEAINSRNGGVRCDVTSGPCSCGAWH